MRAMLELAIQAPRSAISGLHQSAPASAESMVVVAMFQCTTMLNGAAGMFEFVGQPRNRATISGERRSAWLSSTMDPNRELGRARSGGSLPQLVPMANLRGVAGRRYLVGGKVVEVVPCGRVQRRRV